MALFGTDPLGIIPEKRQRRLRIVNCEVAVSGNWRIVFRLKGGLASDVDLIDYHEED